MDLWILDKTFKAIGIIDSFESILWVDRYSAFGDFELYTPVNLNILSKCQPDYYVTSSNSDRVMIIEERNITSDVEKGDMLVIKGRSLASILIHKIVWDQTTITGNIQNGIKKLLNDSIMNPNITDRRISNFIFEESTDSRIMNATLPSAQYTGKIIYEVIMNICIEQHWGFKILLNDKNQFVFSLYKGEDRSYDQIENPYVVFSPQFDNIINSNYLESKVAFKNVALVAGEGEGSDRKRIVVGSGVGLDRRELYVDARDISSTTDGGSLSTSEYDELLTQRGYEKLSETLIVKAFEGQVESTQTFVLGEDFFLGDIVQIENEYAIEARSRVSEIIYSASLDSQLIVPTFSVMPEDA